MLDAVEGPVKWYYEGRGTSVKLRALIQMDMLARTQRVLIVAYAVTLH